MANQEHLDLFKQGVVVWNQWKKEHPDIQLDLVGVNLSRADLRGANLSYVNLSKADLEGALLYEANCYSAFFHDANLHDACLRQANFWGADLSQANLCGANCRRARLEGANFWGADLAEADLSEADLSYALLVSANLNGTNLSGAYLDDTNLSGSVMVQTVLAIIDLIGVKGLEDVLHQGPSSIDIHTLARSKGNIPEAFLRQAGIPDSFIITAQYLIDHPIDYYSCFISYTSRDDAFAKRLYADLQSNGVRCWFAPKDLKIGDHYHQRIDESIRLYDKLILILSEYAVQSTWVEREVVAAREKEDRGQRPVLFPIRLDDAVMDTTRAWAADVRRRWHIGDFTRWKDHDTYQVAFERLLRDLKAGDKS